GGLTGVSAPDGSAVQYQYDGPLVTSVQWSGPVRGSVSYVYDNDLRITSEGGAAFGYDSDGLLTAAGAMQLRHDPANGLLTGTTLGGLTDNYTYNEFGEVTGYSATLGTAPIYSEAFVRDAVGRVQQRSETVNAGTSVEVYSYDLGGRLSSVTSGIHLAR